MLLLGIGVCLCWIYGRQIILVYGYRASDIPVHMSWINEMSRGKIFCERCLSVWFSLHDLLSACSLSL